MDYTTLLASGLAIVSAVVAVYALTQQRRAAQLVVNTHFLNDQIRMLVDHPTLLSLHGVEPSELDRLGITEVELAYMLNSIYAGQAYYAAGQSKKVVLSTYRQYVLNNPKFEKAWKAIIRDRLTLGTPFSEAIDNFYKGTQRH